MNGWNRKKLLTGLAVLILGFAVFATNVFADDERTAPASAPAVTKAEPAKEAEAPLYLSGAKPVEALPGGWMMLMGRIGGGSGSTDVTFDFKDVPRDKDATTEAQSDNARVRVTGVEAIFYPTKARHFLLSAAFMGYDGYSHLKFNDDHEKDFGASVLKEHRLSFNANFLEGGIGYRFLYGRDKKNATNLQFKLGLGSGNIAVDDVFSQQAGGGLAGLSVDYMRRFDDHLFLGVQWELVGWGLGTTDIDIDSLNTKADVGIGGGMSVMTICVGYEAW